MASIHSRERSIVWLFYKKPSTNKDKIKCPLCPTTYKYSGATTGLLTHLRVKHPKRMDELMKEIESSGIASSDDSLTHIAQSFATGQLPFRFAENPEFRKFIVEKPVDFRPPNASQVKERIDELADHQMVLIRSDIQSIKDYAIVSDGYSARRGKYKFYSLHVFWIDEDFERHEHFCSIRAVEKKDTVSVAKTLTDSLAEVGLHISECSSITCDGGTELGKCSELQEIDRIHCGCHLLDLVISDFVKDRYVKEVHCKVQEFAAFLSRHENVRETLKTFAKARGIASPPPTPVAPTRWAGLAILVRGFIEYYDVTKDLSVLKHFLLKADQLKKLKDLGKILEPIHAGILKLERKDSFASEIIPTMYFIRHFVNQYKTDTAQKLVTILDNRLKYCLKNKRLACTMLCDHRFAYDSTWDSLFYWPSVENWLIAYDKQPSSFSSPASSQSKEVDIATFLNFGAMAKPSGDSDLSTELLRFRTLMTTDRPRYQCPLDFWKGHKENYPRLASISKTLFSSPASSADAERLFSTCTEFVHQTKRNRASVPTINNILTVSIAAKKARTDHDQTDDYIESDNTSDNSEDEEHDSNADESEKGEENGPEVNGSKNETEKSQEHGEQQIQENDQAEEIPLMSPEGEYE